MANIQPQIDAIRTARFGRDVRESIASGMEAMNGESSTAYSAAITAQNSASASALAAKQSEDNALDSANNAQTQATNAQNSAAAAKASEDNASVSATTATNAAGTSQNILVQVQASATAAKSSEDAATAAADSAAKSAKDSKDSRDQALQSANDALTSATNADNSRTQAGISEVNAAKSAKEAADSAAAASAIAKIDVAKRDTPGLVKPDNDTIEVDGFGTISVPKLPEHIADKMVSSLANQDGVHGIRVYTEPTTKKRTLQTYDTDAKEWVTLFTDLKMPDDGTITMDADGTIHGANILPLSVVDGKLCVTYKKVI